MTSLFDQHDRFYVGPARHAEASFPYWNRSARGDIALMREKLESWFARYPEDHRSDLRARFRSSDEFQYRGAFFELFLHEMLLQLSYQVEVHPPVPGTTRRPEFRATSAKGEAFYLEAKVANDESKDDAIAARRINEVYDAINRLGSSDFWVNVECSGQPRSLIPIKTLRQFLQQRLAEVRHEDLVAQHERSGFDELPRWPWSHDGWEAEFFPIPKRKVRGDPESGTLGFQMSLPEWTDPVTPVREAILDKAKRYGSPDLPFVIAVNAVGGLLDEDQALEVLFGDEEWVSRYAGDPFRLQHRPNGVWTRSCGRYRRVSAVLLCYAINPWNFPTAKARLYHHPLASRPLDPHLQKLPTARIRYSRLEYDEGATFAEIFSTPPDWLSTAV